MALTSLLRCLQAFMALDRELPVSMATTFMTVALNEGLSMREYCDLAGMPQSTMSRQLLDLGERARDLGPGLGLIERRQVPDNLRTNEYRLSPKGRVLLRKLFPSVG